MIPPTPSLRRSKPAETLSGDHSASSATLALAVVAVMLKALAERR